MRAAFQDLEEHFHRVQVQAILLHEDGGWLSRLLLLIECSNLVGVFPGSVLAEDRMWLDTEQVAKSIRIGVELADWLVLFHVDALGVDGVALFVPPNVRRSYFGTHFKLQMIN